MTVKGSDSSAALAEHVVRALDNRRELHFSALATRQDWNLADASVKMRCLI